MLKKICSLLGVAALSLTATAVQAQSVYADVAYQMIDADLETDPALVRGIVGYQFMPNLAAEGMVGLNLREGKDSSYGYSATAKVDRLLGAYVKSSYRINDAFELYGRLGVVSYKVSASVASLSASASDSGSDLSFGIGASYYLAPTVSLNMDYMNFGDLEGGLALGLKFSF